MKDVNVVNSPLEKGSENEKEMTVKQIDESSEKQFSDNHTVGTQSSLKVGGTPPINMNKQSAALLKVFKDGLENKLLKKQSEMLKQKQQSMSWNGMKYSELKTENENLQLATMI